MLTADVITRSSDSRGKAWISAPQFNENHPYVLEKVQLFSLQMTHSSHFLHLEERIISH